MTLVLCQYRQTVRRRRDHLCMLSPPTLLWFSGIVFVSEYKNMLTIYAVYLMMVIPSTLVAAKYEYYTVYTKKEKKT